MSVHTADCDRDFPQINLIKTNVKHPLTIEILNKSNVERSEHNMINFAKA